MKLASLRNASRDGQLLVVAKDLTKAVIATNIATTMQIAIESWDISLPKLKSLYDDLNDGGVKGEFELDTLLLAAPLPRAYQWLDGSAFNNHGELMARAFNLDKNIHDQSIPLVYQGAADDFLGPREEICVRNEEADIDFEGELGVVVTDVAMGTSAFQATEHIILVTQLNDVSLRAHAMREMKTGFGWLHAKPATSFAPVFVTLDELGDAWQDGRVDLPVHISWNDEWFGHPNAREMNFSFFELIEYVAQTRNLGAGTIIGSGTVSNVDRASGSACIAERRAIEMIDCGKPLTEFMKFGDRVHMEVRDAEDSPLFGAIDQKIVKA